MMDGMTPMAKVLWIALAVMLFLIWPQMFLLLAIVIGIVYLVGRQRESRD